jgi:hypothetical protein
MLIKDKIPPYPSEWSNTWLYSSNQIGNKRHQQEIITQKMKNYFKANSIVSSVLHGIELIIFMFTITTFKHMFPVKIKSAITSSNLHHPLF